MKKLDVVKTTNGFVGRIVKYPSNSQIEIDRLIKIENEPNFIICTKNDIVQVLSIDEINVWISSHKTKTTALPEQEVTFEGKVPKLLFSKGDTVKTITGVVGQICNYPSNSRIHLMIDPRRNVQHVTSKDKICEVVSKGEYVEYTYPTPEVIKVPRERNGFTMTIEEFKFNENNNYTLLEKNDRCLVSYKLINDRLFRFLKWKEVNRVAIVENVHASGGLGIKFECLAECLAKHPSAKKDITYI